MHFRRFAHLPPEATFPLEIRMLQDTKGACRRPRAYALVFWMQILLFGAFLASCSSKEKAVVTDSSNGMMGKTGMSGMDSSNMSGMSSMDKGKMTGMSGMDSSKMSGMSGMSDMEDAKMSGMSGNPDQNFLRMMSDHHTGMIAMAHPTKNGKGSTDAVRDDAKKIDAAQDAEIATMLGILKKDFKDPYKPMIRRHSQMMTDSLLQQTGSNYDHVFYMNTIMHHREALAMIDQFLPKLTRPDLKAMAQKMKVDQMREIAEFERKLGK